MRRPVHDVQQVVLLEAQSGNPEVIGLPQCFRCLGNLAVGRAEGGCGRSSIESQGDAVRLCLPSRPQCFPVAVFYFGATAVHPGRKGVRRDSSSATNSDCP